MTIKVRIISFGITHDKIGGHCEDSPVGGDEAISWDILQILLILSLGKREQNGDISF
jgi:hypothetical protein